MDLIEKKENVNFTHSVKPKTASLTIKTIIVIKITFENLILINIRTMIIIISMFKRIDKILFLLNNLKYIIIKIKNIYVQSCKLSLSSWIYNSNIRRIFDF